MTRYLRFINHRYIVTQMIAVVLAAVVLGTVCTSVAFLLLSYGGHNEANLKLAAASAAARIATIADDARQSVSLEELKRTIKASRWLEMHIEIVPSAVFFSSPEFTSAEKRTEQESGFADELRSELLSHWNLSPLDISISTGNSVVVKINNQYALIFQTTHRPPMQRFIFIQLGFVVATVMIVVLFLAVYIIKRLMAPLSSIAAAADALGHVSTPAQPISDAGPQEVTQVARALNHLHGRLQSLIEERTRMLAAISHDLRTPLTRLRLKLERGVRSGQLGSMIDEIEIIDNMISETLHYLREQNDRRAGYVIDMPSLIQTICNEFADLGFDIRYQGPARMAYFCEESGMRRALSNVIDNAIKHGTEVVVLLESRGESGFEIRISDNGPGIPKEHRAKVLEPFYIADDARSLIGRSGFGLGLSIVRDVVSRHRGTISFADNSPSGLVVRLAFNQSRSAEFAS
ncbi:sensor histidine kinase [Rhizobium hainanense]|uniref:histidine kinase n=1 Tax=Rhizobium hainanense TaxID=52131 RepID=A0A1C3USX1_9HYPH|nr:ATP-binding protein [Rhizobium hainanense]SCB18600.1 Signal transduction histidine kinase [Rhizobium hainanense]